MIRINGVDYGNANSVEIRDGKVIIDGKPADVARPDNQVYRIEVEGILNNLTCDREVVCGQVNGNIQCGGSVQSENIGGNIDCGGSVQCGDVKGNVNCGGSVNCGNIGGDVDAGGSVRCASKK